MEAIPCENHVHQAKTREEAPTINGNTECLGNRGRGGGARCWGIRPSRTDCCVHKLRCNTHRNRSARTGVASARRDSPSGGTNRPAKRSNPTSIRRIAEEPAQVSSRDVVAVLLKERGRNCITESEIARIGEGGMGTVSAYRQNKRRLHCVL